MMRSWTLGLLLSLARVAAADSHIIVEIDGCVTARSDAEALARHLRTEIHLADTAPPTTFTIACGADGQLAVTYHHASGDAGVPLAVSGDPRTTALLLAEQLRPAPAMLPLLLDGEFSRRRATAQRRRTAGAALMGTGAVLTLAGLGAIIAAVVRPVNYAVFCPRTGPCGGGTDPNWIIGIPGLVSAGVGTIFLAAGVPVYVVGGREPHADVAALSVARLRF